ncbi:MAG TPA: YgiQ family radical SAM protein [Treponemataceae bacterium]|nr:YgiQ family radical SAM protein [Treponemataceae bacterium]
MNRASFLPVSYSDLEARNWSECDFIIVSGDAYVDHPAFAAALLGRLLEVEGYKIGIIAQPRWTGPESTADFTALGLPRLAWFVTAGAMDSMVAHYTANNKPRSDDAYSPGGKAGFRPDRALLAYTSKIKEISKGIPVIIGGIEASLRRMGHYDYWSNTLKHSLLLDTKADLLVYGMGENPILEIASRLAAFATPEASQTHNEAQTTRNMPPELLRGIRGTCWRTGKESDIPEQALHLPDFDEIKNSKEKFCEHFVLQEKNTDPFNASILVEKSESRFVVQEKPGKPLSQKEFDRVMELPYTRAWHPDYDSSGGIPGLTEVLFSLTSCRGCFGACSFCAITFHQGRLIQTRSHESLEKEARSLVAREDFKGYIHDVGGPSANFRVPACEKQNTHGACQDRQCLGDVPCPALKADHKDYISLLRRLRAIPGIKKVFVRSGIRFDYVMHDPDSSQTFLKELCEHHISGQLKVAPEHTSDSVLALMRKSTHNVYVDFEKTYNDINNNLGKKQFLVPYYIASHPGARLEDALHNALELQKKGFVPDQVQDFYPTPGTHATCMYWTGIEPWSKEEVYVARGGHERALQRALLQFNKRENKPLVLEALKKLDREDLIPVLLRISSKK